MAGETGVVWYLRASEEELGQVLVISVEGRISNATAAELNQRLDRPASGQRRGIVVDLSGVDYINGAGLRVFEVTASRLSKAGCQLVLCGIRPIVRTAFDLAGPIPHLILEESRDGAVQRVLTGG